MLICSSCRRHVKTTPCPFCGTEQLASTLAAPSNASRLSRGQLVAGAALLGVLAPGCARTETAVPAYGAPAPTQSVAPEPSPSAGGTTAILYGAPPAQDEPAPPVAIDAGARSSKTPDKKQPDNSMAPAYGVPPPDPR